MTCSALVHSEPRSTRRQSEHVIKSVRDSACRHGRRSGIEQCIVELEEARVGAAHGSLAEHEVEEARLAFAHTAHGRDPRLHGRGCGARAPAGRVPARGAIRRIGLRQLRPSSCLNRNDVTRRSSATPPNGTTAMPTESRTGERRDIQGVWKGETLSRSWGFRHDSRF